MAIPPARSYLLNSLSDLEMLHVRAELTTHHDRQAMRLIERAEPGAYDPTLAIISDSDFKDGVIEAEIAGVLREDAPQDMRGFVGIAFHVQPHGSQFECFFLRPTNARADNQLRRNHSTQYISHPDYPWYRLRDETPGVYESYADLVPGAWTTIKIVVSGIRAQLSINGADQPCLIVNDLKLGETRGQIGLWMGAGSEAFFSKLVVKRTI